MADERKQFGHVFEGKGLNPEPLVTLKRIPDTTDVGIYWAQTLIATVGFDDLFDEEGNRFYND